jgi:hypothetical protein
MPAADLFSLSHAVLVVVLGSCLFFLETGVSLRRWPWGSDSVPQNFWTVTTWRQSSLFVCSAVYFLADSVVVSFRSAHTPARKTLFVVHHLWCVLGLVAPIWTGEDGGLVLAGFVMAEAANPLRLWVQHWLLSTVPAPGIDDTKRRQLAKWVTGYVFFAFFLSRLVCLYFTIAWVWPLAASRYTLICASVLLVCAVSICMER